ncbi:MAG TPA: energy transducer TonB, partial [Dokdonella sp.]
PVASTTPPPAATPPPAPAPEPVGETRDARVVTPPRPSYPPNAVRNRQNGWVEVEFTVTESGSVQNVRVVSSEPPRVFDREAIRAVQQAKFEARLERGQPVSSTLRRRIEFKLGN